MKDSKAMLPSPSPHPPSNDDSPGSLSTLPSSKDDFGASVPLHTPTPLPSSPTSSVSAASMAATMAATLRDIAPSTGKGIHTTTYEDLNDSESPQWRMHSTPLMNHIAQDEPNMNFPMHFNARATNSFSYDRTAFDDNYSLAYHSGLATSCPRSLNTEYGLVELTPTGTSMSSYPANMYQMGPQHPYEGLDQSQSPNNNLMQLESEYEEYPLPSIPEDSTAYSTPYDSDISRSSTPISPRMSQDDEPIDGDQPYAQLIYKALLQAPNNTMILRDIYDWFRRNTGKAADKDTKGWQNSIRHNLSMNGVRVASAISSSDLITNYGTGFRESRPTLRRG